MFIENPSRDTDLLDASGELRGENNYRNKNVAGTSIQRFVKLWNQIRSPRMFVWKREQRTKFFSKIYIWGREVLNEN